MKLQTELRTYQTHSVRVETHFEIKTVKTNDLPIGAQQTLKITTNRHNKIINNWRLTKNNIARMEDDTEFRDLIIKKLENNGVLLKLKVHDFIYSTPKPLDANW